MKSQNQNILCHLRSGRPITPIQALRFYGCMRLAARIGELKDAGHDIADRWICVKSATTGRRVKVKQYSLK